MKFIKSLICNCLCINNLYTINKTGINVFKKSKNRDIIYPNKLYSFKKTKKYYLENNIYYDIYNDNLENINNYYFSNTDLNNNNEINYYNFFNIKNSKIKKNKIKNNKKVLRLKAYNKYNKYNDLTAEHIFPQSYIKMYNKAKFDMHNIFLTQGKINSFRSNYKYVDEENYLIKKNDNYYINLNNKLIKYNSSINYKNNTLKLFIPFYSSRGIIARAIIYMKYTYNDLLIENVIDKKTLIKWNSQYPPTLIEKKQNLLIKEVQGNENIFITDYNLINDFIKLI